MNKAEKHANNLKRTKSRDKHTGGKRSPHWPAVEKEHLAKFPTCAACGSNKKLNVHHKKPFHLHPDLELDPNNLITLCMENDCHIYIGHGDDFKAYNPNVVDDAATVYANKDKRFRTTLNETMLKAKKNRLFE